MAIKPILFNSAMVRAILAGRKTQTRRVVKPQPSGQLLPEPDRGCWPGYFAEAGTPRVVNPPYRPGDILWVRETWQPAKGTTHTYIGGEIAASDDWHNGFEYKVGNLNFPDMFEEINDEFRLSEVRNEGKWHPSIHMPKEAARIFLRVTDVRVERLQEISEEQAEAEGAPRAFEYRTPEGPLVTLDERGYYDLGFKAFWDSTVKKADLPLYGWKANPWVWVIEFERCEKPEGWCA